jgi:hypothetical protein
VADTKKSVKSGIMVTPEILEEIRAAIPAMYSDGHRSRTDVAKTLTTKYPQFSINTLEKYIGCVDQEKTSNYLFSLMSSKEISINLFFALSSGVLDKASKDTLAETALRHPRLEANDIVKIKQTLKANNGRIAIGTAVMMARGALPSHAKPEDVKKSMKFFGGIIKELNDASLFLQTRIEQAIEIIPGSAIEDIDVHMDVYHKLTALEASLSNALRFVKEARPRYLEIVKNHVITEAGMTMKRTEGGL